MRFFVSLGSINALLAVALGAFGAHLLKNQVTPDLLIVWEKGTRYQMYHGLGLILTGILQQQFPGAVQLRWVGWVFFAGILLFSGSLYIMTLTGVRALGAITPIGGICFLVGWTRLAFIGGKK